MRRGWMLSFNTADCRDQEKAPWIRTHDLKNRQRYDRNISPKEIGLEQSPAPTVLILLLYDPSRKLF